MPVVPGRAVTPWWWSVLLAAVGVGGLWLAGRRSWTGWAVGLAAQGLWVAYALASRQYGFLVSAVAYGSVYAVNLRRWLAERGGGLVEPVADRVGEPAAAAPVEQHDEHR